MKFVNQNGCLAYIHTYIYTYNKRNRKKIVRNNGKQYFCDDSKTKKYKSLRGI